MGALADRRPVESSHRVASPRQIVMFEACGHLLGVDVASVREIRGWQPATSLPHAEADVLGVINLRGAVLAVHDLARRLNLSCDGDRRRSGVIIVVDVDGRQAGMLADTVSDIVDLAPEQVRPVPCGTAGHQAALAALALTGDRLVALLDLAAVLRLPAGA